VIYLIAVRVLAITTNKRLGPSRLHKTGRSLPNTPVHPLSGYSLAKLILKRNLFLWPAVLLTCCTPTISPRTITEASLECDMKQWRTWVSAVACYSRHERPLWASEGSRYFDLFQLFDNQRRFLATQVDAGMISEGEYRQRFQTAIQNLAAAIQSRDALRSERYAKIDEAFNGLALGAAAGYYGESAHVSSSISNRPGANQIPSE
jgi:hypothetical protein